MVASQKEHPEKKKGLLEIKNLEQRCKSSTQGIEIKKKITSKKQKNKTKRKEKRKEN